MRKLFWLIVPVVVALTVSAQERSVIAVKPPKGWTAVETLAPVGGKTPFPTTSYRPQDKRNARVMVTVNGKPDGRVTDMASLRAFHVEQCAPYQTLNSPESEPTEFKTAGAVGIYTSFEDPKLIGRAAPAGEFKVVTPVAILLENGVIVRVLIFSDEVTGPTMTEALQLVESISTNEAIKTGPVVTRPVDRSELLIVSMPDLDMEMGVPKKGMEEAPYNPNEGDPFFSYLRNDGVTISGWLEPIAKFSGFRKHWWDVKGKLERDQGGKVLNETFTVINGWRAVFYVFKLQDTEQWCLRACRTSGNTWFDVYIFTTTKYGATSTMKELLESVQVGPKGAEPPIPRRQKPPPTTVAPPAA